MNGIAECQHYLLNFRGEMQKAEDLRDVSPRHTQLPGQSSSGCSFTAVYSLLPFSG